MSAAPVAPSAAAPAAGLAGRLSVLAFAQELSDDPSLLNAWVQAFTGADPIELVIHPGELSGPLAAELVSAAVEAAGVGDDDGSADLELITGPLDAADEDRLRRRCAAVFTRLQAPPVFAGLQVVSPGTSDSLRAMLAQRPAAPPAGLHQVDVGNGHRVLHRATNADVSVIRDIFGEHSYSLARHLKPWTPGLARLSDPSQAGGVPLIVDLGANIGVSAMYFKLAFPAARVIAVEPEPENFSLLRANLAPFDNVLTLQKAIAAEPGTITLSDPGEGGWAFRTGAEIAAGTIVGEVPATTIDEVLDAERGAIPFVLKIDVEGAEGDLFSDRWETFARFPVVIIELHDWMLPGHRTSLGFLEWHVAHRRELIHVGETIFSVDPDRLGPPGSGGR